MAYVFRPDIHRVIDFNGAIIKDDLSAEEAFDLSFQYPGSKIGYKDRNEPEYFPVLKVSTNQSGSHFTIFKVGTKADELYHDKDNNGNPIFSSVMVEMVSLPVKEYFDQNNSAHFSDMEDWQNFYDYTVSIYMDHKNVYGSKA
jgi:hypothetical protein